MIRTDIGSGFQDGLDCRTPSLRAKRSNPHFGAQQWIASSLSLLAMTKEDSRRLVAEIRLHRAVDLDGERIAIAILGGARGHAHPALADAILLDIGFLDALESNADVARQHLLIVVRAFRIGRQTVRQLVAHGIIFLFHVLPAWRSAHAAPPPCPRGRPGIW